MKKKAVILMSSGELGIIIFRNNLSITVLVLIYFDSTSMLEPIGKNYVLFFIIAYELLLNYVFEIYNM